MPNHSHRLRETLLRMCDENPSDVLRDFFFGAEAGTSAPELTDIMEALDETLAALLEAGASLEAAEQEMRTLARFFLARTLVETLPEPAPELSAAQDAIARKLLTWAPEK